MRILERPEFVVMLCLIAVILLFSIPLPAEAKTFEKVGTVIVPTVEEGEPLEVIDEPSQKPKLTRRKVSQTLIAVLNGEPRYGISVMELRQHRELSPDNPNDLVLGKPLSARITRHMYTLPKRSYKPLGIKPGQDASIYGNNLILRDTQGNILTILRDVF